jgi:HD-like signal output (HDOD) protein
MPISLDLTAKWIGSKMLASDAAKLLIICHCGQKMKVPADAVGKTVSCVKCGDKVTITAEESSDPIPADFENEGDPDSGAPHLDDVTDLLLNAGLVDQSMLDDVELVQRDLPGAAWSILMDMNHLDSESFHDLMAKAEGIANIELENYSVPDDVLTILPENLVRQYFVIPVDKLGKLLTLAMVCPHNHSVIQEAENITGLRVKSMLCTYDAMRETIKKKLPFSDVDGDDSITEALAKEFENPLNYKIIARRVFRIHTIPPAVAEFYQLQDVQEDNLTELTKLAADNPVLLGRALQIANSAAYGFSGSVTTVGHAAALLGPETLHQAMHSKEAIDYKKQHKDYDIGAHLKRARFCAIAAQSLAKEIDSVDSDTANSVGLLFEIGRLVLLRALPNGYPLATQEILGRDLHEVEMRLYQFPYTEAGYYILRKWNLPHAILEPIRFQTSPKESNQSSKMTNILFLSIIMTKAFINNTPLHIRTDEEDSMHSLGVTLGELEVIFQTACTGFQQKIQA